MERFYVEYAAPNYDWEEGGKNRIIYLHAESAEEIACTMADYEVICVIRDNK